MKNLIRYFIKFPILGNTILFTMVLFGIFGFTSTRTTFFPPVPSKYIMISASYPGAAPDEIEEAIVLKIEDNLKGVTGVERVTSVSRENACSINVEMTTGYDIDVVLQDVKNAVEQVSTFPDGMEQLKVFKQEMISFAADFVISGDVDLKVLKQYSRKAERDLLSMDGISKVSLSGFPNEEIEISMRENDLRALGLTFTEVVNSIKKANIKVTGGTIKGKKEELQIRADLKGYYAKDLANHVLRTTDDGNVIYLKDVADVIDRWSESPNRVYFNGQRCVRVTIQNLNEEDLFHIAGQVKEYVADFNNTHSDAKAFILRDGSEIIKERIDILTSNGLLGMFLVLLLLTLSLNIRMAFWVAIAIPISFAGMFMLSPFYDLTINVMSLMAMILVLGILVDDGIVIAENIYQHHERGKKPIQAAVDGTIEVLPSVTASILTTVVVFSTFFFLEGGLGDRARDIAFVVIATLMISLVEGMLILPAHIAHSRALRVSKDQVSKFEKWTDTGLKKIRDKVYSPVLKFAIHHPVVVLSIPIAVMLITVGALKGGILKTTFFPFIERRSVNITLEMPAGTPVAITDSILAGIETHVWEVNDMYKESHNGQELVTELSRNVGGGTHQGGLRVELISGEHRDWSSMDVQNHLRSQIGIVPGAQTFQVGGGGNFGMPVSIAMHGDDLDELREAKEILKGELRQLEKLKDVIDDDPPGLREVHIQLKDKAFALGLNTADVVAQVRSGFFGSEAQRILRGIDEVKIWARYAEQDRSSIKDLEDMRIRLSDGREFPLKEIAEFTIQRGVMAINHIDAQRVISVEADVANQKDSVPEIISQIKAEILPDIAKQFPDIHFDFEGQSRENAKTVRAMKRVLPPVLIMMFFIVVVTFRSFSQASIVFSLIPFSLIGVLWGHYIQGHIVSMLSLFGTIALAGIVVNDSLVFISAFNQKLKKGVEFNEALLDAGLSRFRPVMLTSLTTIGGLGPLIFEKSHQAQFLSPMAISVAYGLIFGTLITLIVLPSFLSVASTIRVFGFKLATGKSTEPAALEPAVREDVFASKY